MPEGGQLADALRDLAENPRSGVAQPDDHAVADDHSHASTHVADPAEFAHMDAIPVAAAADAATTAYNPPRPFVLPPPRSKLLAVAACFVLGFAMLFPAVWAVWTLTHASGRIAGRREDQTMAMIMLVSWPIAATLFICGGVMLKHYWDRLRRAAQNN